MSDFDQTLSRYLGEEDDRPVPPIAVVRQRKRARDRRRLAASGGVLGVSALVGAFVVAPGLTGGGDRVVTAVGSGSGAARVQFEVSYTGGSEAHGEDDEAALRSCTAYPGGSLDLTMRSDPPIEAVSVIGRPAAVERFRRCLENLPDARVMQAGSDPLDRLVAITLDYRTPVERPQDDLALLACLDGPVATAPSFRYRQPPLAVLLAGGTDTEVAEVERCLSALPDVEVTVQEVGADADTSDYQETTFYVSTDGTADAAAYTAGVERCLEVPGVSGSSVQERYPANYELRAGGGAADVLAECLAAAPGARVEEAVGSAAEGAGLEVFIQRCVGAAENAVLTPALVGLPEDEATRESSRVLAEGAATVRVIGRDGTCLGRTRDLRSDRVNLLIADGKVVWAGRF